MIYLIHLDSGFILNHTLDQLIEIAKGTSMINPKVFREGIVIRPLSEKMDLKMAQGFGNGRLSFKVINNDYLLQYEE